MIAALLLSAITSVIIDTYELPVTRDGVTTTRVAVNNWLGEYPSPDMSVASPITVKGYESVRALTAPADCAITPGRYHPDAKTKTSALEFFTLVPLETYSVTADAKIDNAVFKKGDKLIDVVYLAEGACRGMLVKGKAKPKLVEFDCGGVYDSKAFTMTSKRDEKFNEQWVHVQCTDGHKAFVRDQALLEAPGVTQLHPGEP
jgi:hypothetical protein